MQTACECRCKRGLGLAFASAKDEIVGCMFNFSHFILRLGLENLSDIKAALNNCAAEEAVQYF